jgi:hypothetical protein
MAKRFENPIFAVYNLFMERELASKTTIKRKNIARWTYG